MKVTKVKSTPLAVPFIDPHVTWMGSYPFKSTVLIEVETDEGIVGLGESPGVPFPEVNQIVIQEFAKHLTGQDPFNIISFNEKCVGPGPQGWHRFRALANYAAAGLDMALWDIVGKALNQPLHRLLGGAVRDRINCYGWVSRKDPESEAKQTSDFKKKGFTVIYMKGGLGLKRDTETLEAVRAAGGPDMAIRIDINGGWETPGEAVWMINQLKHFGLDWVEQPVIEADHDGLAYVHDSVDVPICIDQGAQTNDLAFAAIKRRIADIFQSDPHRMGGILPYKEIAAMANLANMFVSRHAGPEFGISATACLHASATIPNLTTGNQTYATLIADDIVNEETRKFEKGCLTVPNLPGIGVSLNYDKVEKYREMYLKSRENSYRVVPPE
jgi:L-alanine-DL-glutamate epimerase-like enolase superfamily enzyme